MSREMSDSSYVDTYSVSKRLSFDFNTSKRPDDSMKRSRREDDVSCLKRSRREEDLDSTSGDLSISEANNSSAAVGMSPWESRRVKVDLIEARAKISHLKRELDCQHQLKINMEAMFQDKVDGLTKEVVSSAKKTSELEKHIQVLRKRESTAKEELVRATNALKTARQQHEDQVSELKRTNQNLEDKLQCTTNDLQNEMSNLNRDLQMAVQKLSTSQEELSAVQALNSKLTERICKINGLERELEEERQKHQATSSRVKDLQYQLDSYGEWQDVSKRTMGRLSGMGDLEKEVVRLRADLKSSRELVGNKMLLEEQVFDLRSRLERQEKQNLSVVQMQVQIEQLQRELKDWKDVAADHCANGSTPNPITLRNRLEEILKSNVIMSSEKHSDNAQRCTISEEMEALRAKSENYTKLVSDYEEALKQKQVLLQRIQKKLILVAKERDCYKQVIEHYEKETTISGPGSAAGPDFQLQMRLEMLEKSVLGYKELCSNLEKDLMAAKGSSGGAELSSVSSVNGLHREQYERLRKDLDEARLENDRLRRRKEEVELKFEQLALKTSSAEEKRERGKVLHFQANPADLAYEAHKQDVDKLRAEIERLKRTIRKMESDQEEVTSRFNETNNMTCNIREQTELRKQLDTLESKNQHMKEVFKKASQEFREVVYMLFGYRVDRVGNSNYRLSSMYADNEEEYLNFRLNDSAQLDLLETNYSATLAELLRPLASHHSLPVFLSSLTMDLFNRTTVSIM